MTKACPLKAAFITSKLDEIQPLWRDGADVTQETKSTIRSYAQEKYKDILEDILEDADESISIKSIENAIGRVRKQMGIINPRGKRNSPVRGSSDNCKSKKDKSLLKDNKKSTEDMLREIIARLQKETEKWEKIILSCIEVTKNTASKEIIHSNIYKGDEEMTSAEEMRTLMQL